MYPALFLDRDGVIMENRSSYVRDWDDVVFYPHALSALRQIYGCPYKVVIVTNQSVVGRGIIPLARAQAINDRISAEVTCAGGRIDAVFMCPHAPEDGCDCRKPKPGLLLQAAQALRLDLSRSIMVGDKLSDVLAGRAAGVRQSALVLTGLGSAEIDLPQAVQLHPLPTYNTLADALGSLL